MSKNSNVLAASLSIAAIICSGVAFAVPEKKDLEHCKTMSGIAGAVMAARQSGVRMSEAMESAAKGDGYWAAVSTMLVEEAYKEPIHADESVQIAASENFEDSIYASCLRTRDKK